MSRAPFAILAVLAALSVLTASRPPHVARRRPRTTWDSVYTLTQASRGETAYAKSCARCHAASLAGGDESPPLVGGAFLGNWNGLSLSELQSRIKTTMPSDSVGVLDNKLITDVIAYVLKQNGFPAGASELSVASDTLKEITIKTSRP
jgi:mono/diheme cytochrome c family protein